MQKSPLKIKKDILLSKHTTFHIGGPAKYFCVAKNINDLKAAIKMAKKENLPFFILGNGSNVLVSDNGFNGLVLKFENFDFMLHAIRYTLYVGAGLPLRDLALKSVNAGLTGLEWAVGIPGAIGGGVYGNCGAHGHSISEFISKIKTLDPNTLKIKNYINKNCRFAYRESVFKKNKEIILEAEFQLKKGSKKESTFLIKEYQEYRKKGAPYPSAGSVFRNLYPVKSPKRGISPEAKLFNRVKLISPDKIKGGKISAGYLIDECGLKGKIIGGAKIYEGHANTIVNFNNAKATDILALIDLCKKEVEKKFGIDLQTEIQFLGF